MHLFIVAYLLLFASTVLAQKYFVIENLSASLVIPSQDSCTVNIQESYTFSFVGGPYSTVAFPTQGRVITAYSIISTDITVSSVTYSSSGLLIAQFSSVSNIRITFSVKYTALDYIAKDTQNSNRVQFVYINNWSPAVIQKGDVSIYLQDEDELNSFESCGTLLSNTAAKLYNNVTSMSCTTRFSNSKRTCPVNSSSNLIIVYVIVGFVASFFGLVIITICVIFCCIAGAACCAFGSACLQNGCECCIVCCDELECCTRQSRHSHVPKTQKQQSPKKPATVDETEMTSYEIKKEIPQPTYLPPTVEPIPAQPTMYTPSVAPTPVYYQPPVASAPLFVPHHAVPSTVPVSSVPQDHVPPPFETSNPAPPRFDYTSSDYTTSNYTTSNYTTNYTHDYSTNYSTADYNTATNYEQKDWAS